MISIKKLCKTYHPKGGVSVRALNNVYLELPETGMVFILGKAGSGKSTFLNILGGLDRYDSGEIIIEGKSSKSFSQGDFDSYRNTFVGFIFQEYNILQEFSVAKNIGLALELQGKNGDHKTIDAILEKVDLKGYGKRKPNELSGGQKQRVAIARALVKDPAIIMADEPTGALDSSTGRQVLETLRKLSETKLVIVVSHDREYAEQFGARIVEFADGVIVNDETKYYAPPQTTGAVSITDGKIMQIKAGQELTAADTETINRFLKGAKADTVISIDNDANAKFRRAARINESGDREAFAQTEEVPQKPYNAKDFKLIRSRLPWKDSLRMGASSLKAKPVRLVFTVLLSVVAFTLFGLADTLGSYNKVTATLASMLDSGIKTATLEKQLEITSPYGNYSYMTQTTMTEEDITTLNQKLNDFDFIPVWNKSIYLYGTFNSYNSGYSARRLQQTNDFLETDQNVLNMLEFKIDSGYGRLPTNNTEVAISKHLYWLYTQYGYMDPTVADSASDIDSPSKLLGKKLYLGIGDMYDTALTIVGIIDTGFNDTRYAPLFEDTSSSEDGLNIWMLSSEYSELLQTSLHAVAFVKPNFYDEVFKSSQIDFKNTGIMFIKSRTQSRHGSSIEFFGSTSGAVPYSQISASDKNKIIWANGYSFSSTLAVNEIIVSLGTLESFYRTQTQDSTQIDWESLSEVEKNTYFQQVLGKTYSATENSYTQSERELKVIGVHDGVASISAYGLLVCSDALFVQLVDPDSNPIKYAIAPLTDNNTKDLNLVKFSYETNDGIRYSLSNEVSSSLNSFNNLVEGLSKAFLYIGIFFAVFASLMIMNFISTSISYKKREIGILRAVGARSSDVFSIFFNESLVIALINFVIAAIAVFGISTILNSTFRDKYGLIITIFSFGIRQLILILIVSVGAAFIASFIPTTRISNKKPIDAINNS
ncbi:MAG: ABC transporter ATP-binding protein/permease [Dehalococcoidia bacterium]|nr:ABC transporter ATP-binding protein/permease [Dehalococcoidia bacterium]